MAKDKGTRGTRAQDAFESSKDATFRKSYGQAGECSAGVEFTDEDGVVWTRRCGAPLRGFEERKGITVHVHAVCDAGHTEDRYGRASEPADVGSPEGWLEIAS